MRKLHQWLGALVALPVLAWSVSGLLYVLPGPAEPSVYGRIDAARVRVGAVEALRAVGKPVSALTLQSRDGRTEWVAIAGLDEVHVDAETGAVLPVATSAPTRLFRQLHFWWFAGAAQQPLQGGLALAAGVSALSGLWLFARARGRPRTRA